MGRNSNSGGKYYAINDRVGSTRMPVEGTEGLRSFSDGTGIRKYDKNDPSVAKMRKDRAKAYATRGVGVGLAAQSSHTSQQSVQEVVAGFKNGRKIRISIGNIKSISNVQTLVYQLTSVRIADEQCRVGVEFRIAGESTAYSAYIQKQENDNYFLKLKIDGTVKKRRQKTLLELVKEQKRKATKTKSVKAHKASYEHANSIRGFEQLDALKKKL